MTSLFRRLWRLEGTIDRKTYIIGGVAGVALKYAIDWTIATLVFHQHWTPLNYWRFAGNGTLDIKPPLFLTLFLLALPFLWFGMAMTLLRLRDAGRSAGCAVFFFMPVINLAFFVTLSILPPRPRDARDHSGDMEAAFFVLLLTVGIAAAAVAFSTKFLQSYGMGLFIALPFSIGYLSGFLVSRRTPDRRGRPYVVTLLALALLGGFLLALAWEGVVCLLMALPLALVAGLIGAYCGALSARRFATPRAATVMVLLLPLAMVAENAAHREAPLYAVETRIVVDAPAETV